MSTRLKKRFFTKPDNHGFANKMLIEVNYDHEQDSVDDVIVLVWSDRLMSHINISDIFDSTPFLEVVDSINWPEIYRESLEEKEVEHA